jgi:hypothetical protein
MGVYRQAKKSYEAMRAVVGTDITDDFDGIPLPDIYDLGIEIYHTLDD